jgi:hypothetical protein
MDVDVRAILSDIGMGVATLTLPRGYSRVYMLPII